LSVLISEIQEAWAEGAVDDVGVTEADELEEDERDTEVVELEDKDEDDVINAREAEVEVEA